MINQLIYGAFNVIHDTSPIFHNSAFKICDAFLKELRMSRSVSFYCQL